jgi:hypothetical protein
MIRENPKPWKNNYALVHGLVQAVYTLEDLK